MNCCPDIGSGYYFIFSILILSFKNNYVAEKWVLTLEEFTIQDLRNFPNATGELSSLLRDIGLAGKRINVEVPKQKLVKQFSVWHTGQ